MEPRRAARPVYSADALAQAARFAELAELDEEGPGAGASGPSDTVMVTVAPLLTLLPAVGFWLMTLPFATVSEYAFCTLTFRPAFDKALFAPASV